MCAFNKGRRIAVVVHLEIAVIIFDVARDQNRYLIRVGRQPHLHEFDARTRLIWPRFVVNISVVTHAEIYTLRPFIGHILFLTSEHDKTQTQNKSKILLSHLLYTFIGEYLLHFRVKADRKSTRLNSSHVKISYAVFCL